MADIKAKISAELLDGTPKSGANILLTGASRDVLFLWALIGLHFSQDAGIPLEIFVSMVITSITNAARNLSKTSITLNPEPAPGKDGATQ